MEFNKPEIFKIVRIAYPRGSMSVLQYPGSLPVEPVAARWITGRDENSSVGGRAHYASDNVITALAGSFRVITESKWGTTTFELSRPDEALYLPSMTWYEIDSFTTGATALITSDSLPDPDDDITDKREFDSLLKNGIN